MIPKKISLRQKVFTYIKNNPNCKKKDLLEKFKGESWNSLKTYRGQFWNIQKKKDISDINSSSNGVTTGRSPLKQLTPESLEQMIIDELNTQRTPQMIKAAIDFVKQLKQGESPVPELDMNKFFLIGEDLES